MNLRFLKLLVAVMGAMLIAGVVALAVAVAARLSHRAPPPAALAAPPITLPRGSTIERMSAGPDRIVLQVDLADGAVELVVIDITSGRVTGIFPLREAP